MQFVSRVGKLKKVARIDKYHLLLRAYELLRFGVP